MLPFYNLYNVIINENILIQNTEQDFSPDNGVPWKKFCLKIFEYELFYDMWCTHCQLCKSCFFYFVDQVVFIEIHFKKNLIQMISLFLFVCYTCSCTNNHDNTVYITIVGYLQDNIVYF